MPTEAVIFWEIIEKSRNVEMDQLLLAAVVKPYKKVISWD